MQFMLPVPAISLPRAIQYTDKILLTGSCFTEHIAGRLAQQGFQVLQNPNGILFNPHSVAASISSYLDEKEYEEHDLFLLNDIWNSWDHHSSFSNIDKAAALQGINAAQRRAADFIKTADWVVITVGSAFHYYLKKEERIVANNHRAPGQWFEKRLPETNTIIDTLSILIERLIILNPNVGILFTISPVRHIRDGVVENNRSKARLIEAVHALCEQQKNVHYFPAYELIIDVLRDYRFYDVDLVHPNYAATSFVWEEFVSHCIAPDALPVMEAVKDIMTAKAHRTRFPGTETHRNFLKNYAAKTAALMEKYPYLNMEDALAYFTGEAAGNP